MLIEVNSRSRNPRKPRQIRKCIALRHGAQNTLATHVFQLTYSTHVFSTILPARHAFPNPHYPSLHSAFRVHRPPLPASPCQSQNARLQGWTRIRTPEPLSFGLPQHPSRRRVKFILVDQLLSLEPGKKIVMAKSVTMAEEYLADHFPGFPVLPGVMMLEASVQTAAWLVRQTNAFAQSLIVLKEARGVRYGTFVSPGQTLTITADAVEIGATRSDFKVKGTVNGATAITARLELSHLNLAQVEGADAAFGKIDATAIAAQKDRWEVFARSLPAA